MLEGTLDHGCSVRRHTRIRMYENADVAAGSAQSIVELSATPANRMNYAGIAGSGRIDGSIRAAAIRDDVFGRSSERSLRRRQRAANIGSFVECGNQD